MHTKLGAWDALASGRIILKWTLGKYVVREIFYVEVDSKYSKHCFKDPRNWQSNKELGDVGMESRFISVFRDQRETNRNKTYQNWHRGANVFI
jgi:hypothetical protein